MKKNLEPSVEDIFLNNIVKNQTHVVIFLMTGIRLEGFIKGFDDDTLLLWRHPFYQLIFKSGVSTIVPQ